MHGMPKDIACALHRSAGCPHMCMHPTGGPRTFLRSSCTARDRRGTGAGPGCRAVSAAAEAAPQPARRRHCGHRPRPGEPAGMLALTMMTPPLCILSCPWPHHNRLCPERICRRAGNSALDLETYTLASSVGAMAASHCALEKLQARGLVAWPGTFSGLGAPARPAEALRDRRAGRCCLRTLHVMGKRNAMHPRAPTKCLGTQATQRRFDKPSCA